MNPALSIWTVIFWAVAAVLVYEQFGYALLLRLIGCCLRRRGETQQEQVDLPSVTLVIPAHNEEEVLQAKLENALAVDYPPEKLGIVVADDASSDRTAEIAQSFADRGVKLLSSAERTGKAGALNRAVREASGEVVCLCDANVMFRPDALRRMVAWFRDPGVGAVTGDVRLASEESNFGEGERTYYLVERMIQRDESRVGSTICVDGGMYVIRRDLFEPLPTDTILDDFVTTIHVLRHGKRVIYEPTAVATENGTPGARQEFRRRARVMAGAIQALKRRQWPPVRQPLGWFQFFSHKLLRWGGPIWLAALLVSNAMLWNGGTFYRATLGVQVLVYLAAFVAALSIGFRTTRLGGITFYFVMSHVAMAWGLIKGILNLQPVTWQRTARTDRFQKAPSRTSS